MASRELQWRPRDIARDLVLQADSPDDKEVLASLVKLLDNDDGIVEAPQRQFHSSRRHGPQAAADRQLLRA